MTQPTLHRGKLARTPKVLSVRPLEREDLRALAAPRPAPRTKLLRETHHRLARMVAAGLPTHEILALTGVSATRLQQLRRDPAFIELIAAYKDKVDESWLRSVDCFHEEMVSNRVRGEAMIAEHFDRAEEEGNLIDLKTLVALVADRADRTGYAKKSINENRNINFADVMAQIARSSGKSNVIDAKANHPSPSILPDLGSVDGGSDG